MSKNYEKCFSLRYGKRARARVRSLSIKSISNNGRISKNERHRVAHFCVRRYKRHGACSVFLFHARGKGEVKRYRCFFAAFIYNRRIRRKWVTGFNYGLREHELREICAYKYESWLSIKDEIIPVHIFVKIFEKMVLLLSDWIKWALTSPFIIYTNRLEKRVFLLILVEREWWIYCGFITMSDSYFYRENNRSIIIRQSALSFPLTFNYIYGTKGKNFIRYLPIMLHTNRGAFPGVYYELICVFSLLYNWPV